MRKYLRRDEVEALIDNARKEGRYGERDACLLLLMYRHGFRVSEVIDLRWSDVDFDGGTILCRRLKSGVDSVHPLTGEEIAALQKLPKLGEFVFVSNRGRKMLRQRVHEIVKRASAGLDLNVHCHTLRHSTAASLVKGRHPIRNIQAYLGHADIGSTLVYAHLDETRFAGMTEAL